MERRGLRWWLKTAGDRRDGRRRGGRGNENEGEGRVGFSGYFNLLIPLSTRPINVRSIPNSGDEMIILF